MNRLIFVFVCAVVLSGILAADCSYDAYLKACANCPFDANGKINEACMGGYKASALSCISAKYPVMSTKYSAGECPEVDACASELSSCLSAASSGNDKQDCAEGSVKICYSSADTCINKAAIKCGEIEQQCPGSSALILLTLGLLGFYRMRKK